jgi:alpha-D-xyloside xylohydrolase
MTRWMMWMLAAIFAVATGCAATDDDAADADDDDADDDDDGGEWILIHAGEMTARIHRDPYSLEVIGPDGRTLVATPDPISGDTGRGINVSPMPFLAHAFQVGDRPKGKWYYATDVIRARPIAGGTEVQLHAIGVEDPFDRRTLAVAFTTYGWNHLIIRASVLGEDDVVYQTGAYRLDPDERFLGLGLQYDSIDSRGKLRMMHLGIGVDLSDQIQNHAPIPFYLSSRGYGLFVEEKGPGYFDMGRATDYAYGYKFRASTLTTHLFYGPDPLAVIEQYTALTGRPPMNPDYLFGHLHWRNVNHDEGEIHSDMAELRAHGVPTSSIMVDAPWQTCYSTFRFIECPDGCLFKDARAVIDTAHEKGYAFYLWTAEYVNRACAVEAPGMTPDNSEQFDAARAAGWLVPLLGFRWEYDWWHDQGAMVNFLREDAYDWYQGLARNVVEMGAQGFKMDGGEYAGADVLGLRPMGFYVFGDGVDVRTIHYDYKQAYHSLFWDLAREVHGENGIATVRCAVWGEQSHVSYFWPGDLDATWGRDLGLPADIVGGLTLGTAGFPYYGSNTGGFSGYGVNPELTARWAELSALRPIFESPRDGTQEVWEDYPAEVFDIYRDYAVFHTRLFPYLKAYAQEATRTGHPILRMLPLHYPDDPIAYDRDFDYLLGERLLVAPVYEEGARAREVYLPAGRWVNWWTGEAIDGPRLVTVDAPLDEIPLFAKGGAIVPLLDPSVQTLWPTDDPEVIDHLDVADRLWIDLYPYGETAFTLVDGTTLTMTRTTGGFTLAIGEAPLARTYSLRAVPATYGGGKPRTVAGPSGELPERADRAAWDAAARGWFFDAAKGDLWVRDAGAGGTFTVAH